MHPSKKFSHPISFCMLITACTFGEVSVIGIGGWLLNHWVSRAIITDCISGCIWAVSIQVEILWSPLVLMAWARLSWHFQTCGASSEAEHSGHAMHLYFYLPKLCCYCIFFCCQDLHVTSSTCFPAFGFSCTHECYSILIAMAALQVSNDPMDFDCINLCCALHV